MFNTLWSNHKPVLAGTAAITAATTGLLVAYKKGWFDNQEEDQN